jgi:hypothetical protein
VMRSSLAGVTSVAFEIILSYHYADAARRCVVSDNECIGDLLLVDEAWRCHDDRSLRTLK